MIHIETHKIEIFKKDLDIFIEEHFKKDHSITAIEPYRTKIVLDKTGDVVYTRSCELENLIDKTVEFTIPKLEVERIIREESCRKIELSKPILGSDWQRKNEKWEEYNEVDTATKIYSFEIETNIYVKSL